MPRCPVVFCGQYMTDRQVVCSACWRTLRAETRERIFWLRPDSQEFQRTVDEAIASLNSRYF